MSNQVATVTQGKWCVGYSSGAGIDGTLLHVFKIHDAPDDRTPRMMIQRGEAYGKRFAGYEEANAYALERGYLQVYRRKVWCREHRILHTFLGKPSPTFEKCWHSAL